MAGEVGKVGPLGGKRIGFVMETSHGDTGHCRDLPLLYCSQHRLAPSTSHPDYIRERISTIDAAFAVALAARVTKLRENTVPASGSRLPMPPNSLPTATTISYLCEFSSSLSTSHHEQRSGIEPLTGSAFVVSITRLRLAPRGLSAS